MGINIQTADSNDMEVDEKFEKGEKNEPPAEAEVKPRSQPEPKPKPEPEPEVDSEEVEKKKRKAEALKEKEAGNAAYKKKEFEKAIGHYTKAVELDDEDVSFLTNRAAVYLEMGDVCIFQRILGTSVFILSFTLILNFQWKFVWV